MGPCPACRKPYFDHYVANVGIPVYSCTREQHERTADWPNLRTLRLVTP